MRPCSGSRTAMGTAAPELRRRRGGRPGAALGQPEPGDQDDEGPLGPLVRAMDQARRTAVERMAAQCAELGGDGVVGLRVSRGSFLLGGQEFTALGTAVRAHGAGGRWHSAGARCEAGSEMRGRSAPFTSDLSGQDFAKLIMAGWVPAGLVLGVAIGACHDDWQTTRQTRRWSGNREIAGWTDVVNQSRRDARGRLDLDVQRLGAEGAVVASMQLRVSVRDCPAQAGRRDHIVEASILGTGRRTRFARADRGGRGPGHVGELRTARARVRRPGTGGPAANAAGPPEKPGIAARWSVPRWLGRQGVRPTGG